MPLFVFPDNAGVPQLFQSPPPPAQIRLMTNSFFSEPFRAEQIEKHLNRRKHASGDLCSRAVGRTAISVSILSLPGIAPVQSDILAASPSCPFPDTFPQNRWRDSHLCQHYPFPGIARTERYSRRLAFLTVSGHLPPKPVARQPSLSVLSLPGSHSPYRAIFSPPRLSVRFRTPSPKTGQAPRNSSPVFIPYLNVSDCFCAE